jgi:hypothetical protein
MDDGDGPEPHIHAVEIWRSDSGDKGSQAFSDSDRGFQRKTLNYATSS